jgi:hypothetical protein
MAFALACKSAKRSERYAKLTILAPLLPWQLLTASQMYFCLP